MPKRSNTFQRLVAELQRQLAPRWSVTESREFNDAVTNEPREVDVVLEAVVAGHTLRVGVEFRDRRDREADPSTLSAEQLAKVLGYLRDNDPSWHPLFLALALTGARFGEVSALHWDDIDTRANVIHIRRAQWKGIEGDTKTGSRRTVPLPDHLAKVLESHRRTLLEAQSPGLARGLVFPTATGKLYRESSLRKPLSRALAAASVEHRFSVHGFRRTFNNLLRQGASGEVVRSMTGHVTERMTEHYSHVSHSEKRAALDSALLSLTALNAVSPTSTGTSGGTSSS